MKLWQKDASIDQLIERFTIGQDHILDLELASYDILGSIAHAKMLHKIDMLTAEELANLTAALEAIQIDIRAGNFNIDDGVEDIHSQVEFILTEKLGDVGKKIHAGRSRNDQVLLDLKLFYRDKIDQILSLMEALAKVYVEQSNTYEQYLMPGYTHMQVGMVSSFGMWYGSFAEAIVDDIRSLRDIRKIINQNPLGSAAGYGNSFPLDREETTKLLGFDDLCYNSMYAQFTRGKTELILSNSLSSISYTLNKFAMDVCLYCGQNHGFIKLPTELTTGSSIMPHKKNPDVFELIRAKSSQLMALPTQIMMITHNLISGYHRDFQQLKEVLFPAIHQIIDILEITLHCVPHISPQQDLLVDDKYIYLYSVEEVNRLVQGGATFRDAYLTVKEQIADESFAPDRDLKHTHLGSLGNLANDRILAKLN